MKAEYFILRSLYAMTALAVAVSIGTFVLRNY